MIHWNPFGVIRSQNGKHFTLVSPWIECPNTTPHLLDYAHLENHGADRISRTTPSQSIVVGRHRGLVHKKKKTTTTRDDDCGKGGGSGGIRRESPGNRTTVQELVPKKDNLEGTQRGPTSDTWTMKVRFPKNKWKEFEHLLPKGERTKGNRFPRKSSKRIRKPTIRRRVRRYEN